MNGPEKNGKAQSPEELVELLDKLMSEGSGHVNIFSDEEGGSVNVETVNSTDCGIKGACCQPTELPEEDED
ncbi:MAG: hypothetical protein IJM55_00195 [Ruminococcus sp.]|jgi:hypothetical protein|nr:hypothetical protein [Ruminococcus sp.]